MSGKDVMTRYVLYSHNLRTYVSGKRQKGTDGGTTSLCVWLDPLTKKKIKNVSEKGE